MSFDSIVSAVNANLRWIRLGLTAFFMMLCLWFLFLVLRALLFPGPVVFAEINLPNASRSTLRWNWYSTATEPVEQEEEQEELAVANINAELLGVVIAGEDSVATIAISRAGAQVFRIGDEIERNVSLEEVEPTRVVISQNGVRRQILLKDVTGKTNRNSNNEESLIRVNEAPANTGGSFNLPGVGSTTPIRLEDGGMGLRLGQVSGEISDLADLQGGDIVLDINGTPVADLFTNPLLWQQFSQETSLPMTVLRGGESEEVYVNAASLFEKIIPQLGAGLIQ